MKELEHGDKLFFTVGDKVFHYTVADSFLNCRSSVDNDAIFIALGLNRTEKIDLASVHYGYRSDQGDWPQFNNRDCAAATRLVKALYDLCNIHNTK